MDQRQLRDGIIAAAAAVGLFLVIAILIEVLSGPLMHTPLTERFYQPEWTWLGFVLVSSIGAIQTRNAWVVVVGGVLYWIIFPPAISWSGPGDELVSARAMLEIKTGLYFGGITLQSLFCWRLVKDARRECAQVSQPDNA